MPDVAPSPPPYDAAMTTSPLVEMCELPSSSFATVLMCLSAPVAASMENAAMPGFATAYRTEPSALGHRKEPLPSTSSGSPIGVILPVAASIS